MKGLLCHLDNKHTKTIWKMVLCCLLIGLTACGKAEPTAPTEPIITTTADTGEVTTAPADETVPTDPATPATGKTSVTNISVTTAATVSHSQSATASASKPISQKTTDKTTVSPVTDDPKKAPKAALDAGMKRLTFFDNFDSSDTIDFSGQGKPGYNWYCDRPYGGSTLTHDEIKVENSVLTFFPKKCSSAIGMPTYSRKGNTGFSYRFGYAEIRMRFRTHDVHPVNGQYPAFWGISVTDFMGRSWTRCGELDIFEAIVPGANAKVRPTEVIYTGTLHEHWKAAGGQKICTNLVNATGYRDQFDFIDDNWHTYGALWEKGHVAWYLDGKLMHAARYAENELPQYYYRDDPNPLPRIEESRPELANRVWAGGHTIMDTDTMVLLLGGHVDWPVEVDWVRVFQK